MSTPAPAPPRRRATSSSRSSAASSSEADIHGDLFDLCRGKAKGRTAAAQITLFKSVGTAIEDLAAAMLVWRRIGSCSGLRHAMNAPESTANLRMHHRGDRSEYPNIIGCCREERLDHVFEEIALDLLRGEASAGLS